MQYDYSEPEYYGPQPPQNQNKFKLKLIIGVCALAVIIAIFIIASSFSTQQSTTLLDITVNDQNATLTALATGKEPKELGTGNVNVRLDPGSYTISAKTANSATNKAVTVTENQTTQVTINLNTSQTPKALAEYTAQDIYAKGSTLYFLNTPFHLINSYTPGDYKVTPFADQAYPLNRVYWINDRQQYAQNTNQLWYYIQDQQPKPILDKSNMLDFSAISFNRNGGFAYVDKSKRVIYQASPTAKPQAIMNNASDNARVALADNGDILIYTPKRAYQAEVVDSKLFSASTNKLTTLPEEVKGIDSVAWAPNNNAFAFATDTGIATYQPSQSSKQQVLTVAPDTPTSLTWTPNNKLLYAQSGMIWNFDPSDESSSESAIITGTLNSNPQPFFVSSDSGTVYYGTMPNDGQGGNIYSFPLGK